MPEANVAFKAAGHIKFGIGGPPDGDLSSATTNFLPVIPTPLTQPITYYRKIYVVNTSDAPYINWKVKVSASPSEHISAKIAFAQDNDEILNSQTPPTVSDWSTELRGEELNLPILEPNQPVGIWVAITALPSIEGITTYTVTISFEGYS